MSHRWIRFRQSPSVLSRSLGNELILAAADTNEFDSLSGTATVVWNLLDAPRTFPDLVSLLAQLYETPQEVIAPQVTSLLDELLEHRLVEEVIDNDV